MNARILFPEPNQPWSDILNDDSITEYLTVVSEDSGVSTLDAEGTLGPDSQIWHVWTKTVCLELLRVGSQGVPGPLRFKY